MHWRRIVPSVLAALVCATALFAEGLGTPDLSVRGQRSGPLISRMCLDGDRIEVVFSDDEVSAVTQERPTVDTRTVTMQFIGGVAGGGVGALVGGVTGFVLFQVAAGHERGALIPAGAIGAVLGGGVGYVIGSACGISIIGTRAGEKGSFGQTLLGTAAGGVLGGLGAGATKGVSFFISPVLGGIVGYYWSAR